MLVSYHASLKTYIVHLYQHNRDKYVLTNVLLTLYTRCF